MKKIYLLSILLGFPFLSNSQTVFTDVNPDSLVTAQYELDLNNDSTPEFLIEATLDGGINIVQASGISAQDLLAGFYGGFPEVVGYPYAYSSGISISSSTNFVDEGVMGGDHALIMEDAQWPYGINRYLGLKFNISGAAHYGWAKIKISTDYVAFTVVEYAYNATAGSPILTGDVTDVEENNSALSGINIYPNPCTENANLAFALSEETSIVLNLTDLSGRTVFSKNYTSLRPGNIVFPINLSDCSNGIYFCTLQTEKGISTHKIVVSH